MIGLILIIIASTNVVRSRNCSDTELCPFDKPFCSEVGCIFECPAPFYINGSNCVSDCGEMFVDENRNCISACPEGTFYKETLKQHVCKPYLERKCVICSWYGMFISNDSCVNFCPLGSRYIDENNCVLQCPEKRPFMIIITVHGLPHYKCRNKCPSMNDGSFCTNVCPENKVVIGSSCLEQCPSNTPYLITTTRVSDTVS
ncbi:receptor tyrosine-protein kinase erbB-4-like, partial [Ruditapes philippinarum]|uniref:receptor tyrosine-protein kinase erbB-4-like n=1 Tax=Ruditapes philippinarum TaxID=129788 RepID=UPI00295B6F47